MKPDLEESNRLFDLTATNMGKSFNMLKGVHAGGNQAEIEHARAAFVSWAEAVADRWLDVLDDQLQLQGICPVTRRRLR